MNNESKYRQSKLVPGMGRVPFPAYHGDEPYIFVSYAHLDHEKVFARIKDFHDRGYRIWYDEGIAPGNEWTAEIAAALKDCALFVVMITPNSVASGNCKNEINFAISRKKPFIAIHLEPTTLSDDLELQIGTKQAILEYGMTPEEYIYKYTNAFQRFGILPDEKEKEGGDPVDSGPVSPPSGNREPGAFSGKKLVIPAAAVLVVVLIAIAAMFSSGGSGEKAGRNQGSDQTLSDSSGENTALAGSEGVTGTGVSETENSGAGDSSGESEPSGTEASGSGKVSDSADDYLYSEKYNGITLDKYAGKDASVVKIPETINGRPVTVVGEKCFENHSEISEVVLPDTVTGIRYNAFRGCTGLTKMNMPASLEQVAGWAFSQTSLKEVTFPDSLKKFEYGAFNSCIKLETVVLPESIVYIDKDTFRGCTKLTRVTIPSKDIDIDIKAFDEDSSMLTLCGVKGSYTERYADVMGFSFEEYK